MTTKTFTIPNISCGHCTSAIENELSALDGVAKVTGDISAKQVTVEWDAPASQTEILRVLKDIGYPAQS